MAVWSFLRGVFRTGRTEVPPAEQVKIRDTFSDRTSTSAADLAARFAAKEITLSEFQSELYLTTRSAFVGQYALGRGGAAAMTEADRATLGKMLGEQTTALRGFVRDISTGTMTAEQIANRAELYPDAAIEAHSRGMAAAHGVELTDAPPAHPSCRCSIDWGETADGGVTITWVTAGDEAVCPICEGLASQYQGKAVA